MREREGERERGRGRGGPADECAGGKKVFKNNLKFSPYQVYREHPAIDYLKCSHELILLPHYSTLRLYRERAALDYPKYSTYSILLPHSSALRVYIENTSNSHVSPYYYHITPHYRCTHNVLLYRLLQTLTLLHLTITLPRVLHSTTMLPYFTPYYYNVNLQESRRGKCGGRLNVQDYLAWLKACPSWYTCLYVCVCVCTCVCICVCVCTYA